MKIMARGIEIHAEELGTGEPALVFLHYWGGSGRTGRHVTQRLAPAYRTIAPDFRGWGDSGRPAEGYALVDLGDDTAAVIHALGLQRFVLVGHSMGGKVAQVLASRRPSGLVGLVLVAPAPPSPMDLPPAARDAMAGAYATRESVEATIDHVLAGSPLDAADREQVVADSLRGSPEAKAAWPKAASLEDITAGAGRIAVPTLVIAGERDQVDQPATLEAELLSRVPQARLQVLPGVGHLSPLEAPDALARLIGTFLTEVEQGGLGGP